MSELQILVRFARPEDAKGILEAHYSAVHETASKDYAAEVASEWSPSVTPDRVEKYLKESFPNETTIVAIIGERIAGFGSIVESINELRAVYVNADFGERGVGAALLSELEKIAKGRGCKELKMVSSLTAAPFYARHNYEEVGRGSHTLQSGCKMACVKMRKTLT